MASIPHGNENSYLLSKQYWRWMCARFNRSKGLPQLRLEWQQTPNA
jgi:hypothetical protein